VLWQSVVSAELVPPLLFAPPTRVAWALMEMLGDGTLLLDIATSLWRVCAGLALGITAGLSIGLLTGRCRLADTILSPLIHLVRPLPPVALIPLSIVWFGIDDTAKILAIACASSLPVWLSTHIGARSLAPEYLWTTKLLTQSRWTMIRCVVAPGALRHILPGIRIALATGFTMVFVSELAGADGGLGYRISIAQLAYRTDQMLAALLTLGALCALMDELVVRLATWHFPWLTPSTAS
jgi:NitT/TauT family transport system permease protein